MKKILIFAALIAVSFSAVAQNKTLQKAYDKMYKQKIKELKKGGWEVTGTAKTLDVALMEHYEKLKNENAQEMAVDVSQCVSLNVCKQAALNNALVTYSNLAGSTLKGRVTSDLNLNSTKADGTEFDKMYAAYERLIQQSVKGVLFESLSLVRTVDKKNNTKEYKAFYIINEDKASKARIKAFENLQKESQMAQRYGQEISKFVQEGFELPAQ